MRSFNEDTRVKIPATFQFLRLGYAYQSGQGVDPDPEEALRWYEKAALAGHRNALVVFRSLNP